MTAGLCSMPQSQMESSITGIPRAEVKSVSSQKAHGKPCSICVYYMQLCFSNCFVNFPSSWTLPYRSTQTQPPKAAHVLSRPCIRQHGTIYMSSVPIAKVFYVSQSLPETVRQIAGRKSKLLNNSLKHTSNIPQLFWFYALILCIKM